MAQDERIDLCIVGAGPAGIAAAERAAARGLRVVLVEAGELGGVSHNWGALPAQALSAAAERAHQIRTARDLGLGSDEPRVNFARINARIRTTIEDAGPAVSPEHLVAQGIEVVNGRGRFTGPAALEAAGRTIRAAHFLIATGSRPIVPNLPGLEAVPYYTPETIFELTRRPSHLIVVGAGATGLALAQSHLRLGAKVSVVEMLEPLSGEDPELVEIVLRRLRAEGLDLHIHTGVVSVSAIGNDEIALDIKTGPDEKRIVGTHLLFATGRQPDFEGLGLEAARVRMQRTRPVLGRSGRTSNRRIFVTGDAAGHSGTHAARHSGERAVDEMTGAGSGEGVIIPHIVHTRPAIARVGMTEAQAATRLNGRFEIVRVAMAETDAARARAEPHGHARIILDAGGRVVGAGVVGTSAPEIIPVLALAVERKMKLSDLGNFLVPYPAFSQIIALAAAEYARSHAGASPAGWRRVLKRLLP
ncbi:dihydrolipoyl dehydrogenase family protein [Pelagibacterium halotolerans]|uniref:Mercuric ion reductase n=1 Tax=Pelagibacterium halotolerans (strain DSM 22347 / JCM 15775 / CGMCC 1.7692 / B2) TaxID=1082931 RepID=G4RGE7_PELHB|nr:FAD-dependent oxidoreductase [Pelagibacterium halotolerans]AEQ50123.1 mercuric ion reductase [Pelagibacterium halotolerans B2]QJR19862.1 FAD-dependent oxidoreductase [Pelagibacterium halotolerans]SEA48491.1 Pyruvate/2-oxoglutarate dehydrogenase complex, dihydrolipoamide dehydrogenase (E3) component [Pelagibacterium halotolerans]